MSVILDFYRGTGTGAGRTFEQVIALDDFNLERAHDWVQFAFPLPEPSKAQPKSPVLTWDEVAMVFQKDEAIRANVLRAVERWLAFLAETHDWRDRYDHNHLRMTRVIRFLTIIGMDDQAQRVLDYALANHPGLPAKTEWYWREARNLEPAWL